MSVKMLNVFQNTAFISALVKFRVVPTHTILHMFKVYIDDFAGFTIESIALLLEGCGRFLLRSPDTRERMATMASRRLLAHRAVYMTLLFKLDLMRRKQALQHLDQRHILLLENAYYQVSGGDFILMEYRNFSLV